MPTLSRTRVLNVLLTHVGELPDIIEAAKDVAKLPVIRPKWDATKRLGDMLVPIAEELRSDADPQLMAAADEVLDAPAEASLCASAGVEWHHLDAVLPVLVNALSALVV
jgi:hypothetical protein